MAFAGESFGQPLRDEGQGYGQSPPPPPPLSRFSELTKPMMARRLGAVCHALNVAKLIWD